MRSLYLAFILSVAAMCSAQQAQNNSGSLVVVLKDGHEKTYALSGLKRIDFSNGSMVLKLDGRQETIGMAQIARMDFADSKPSTAGRNRFVGKWKVGVGAASGTFLITLDRDGQARKSLGKSHGTWKVVNGEAQISWEDGWHDIIRKVGDKHQKVAFEPGKPLDGEPSNVADAVNTDPQPI